ncbi:hypothetical protein [Candidatus Sororendozoicomonas aggregata]|uniref:hypothetical protein n=1 Tax=Candidatus Sororendozoicomonas aggregata TaxID=3073239 RepID=UPI002ED0CF84
MRARYSLQKGHLALIIFTVTNQVSGQVFVGSTRNDLESQWEKMVCAAEQNMDYPLYREIRLHGAEQFHVEEWDFTDDRSELAILEQEALETLGAKSLKGYKTSTVKIKPRKKARQRKSALEKELASLFEELASPEATEEDMPTSDMSSSKNGESAEESTKNTTTEVKTVQSSASKTVNTSAVVEAEPALPAGGSEKESLSSQPTAQVRGSQANAVVNIKGINLGDGITAQLASIQAAADAAIAGDTHVAEELTTIVVEGKSETVVEDEQKQGVASSNDDTEATVELNPKTRRIQQAIARARQGKIMKTAEQQAKERQQLALMLAELEARACAVRNDSLAAAA